MAASKSGPKAPHKPNREIARNIELMAGYGLALDKIAAVVRLSPNTIRKYYADELEHGRGRGHARVAESLMQQAVGRPAEYEDVYDDQGKKVGTRMIRSELKPNVTAAIFYAKSQMGWIESERLQLAGPDDEPLEITHFARRRGETSEAGAE